MLTTPLRDTKNQGSGSQRLNPAAFDVQAHCKHSFRRLEPCKSLDEVHKLSWEHGAESKAFLPWATALWFYSFLSSLVLLTACLLSLRKTLFDSTFSGYPPLHFFPLVT